MPTFSSLQLLTGLQEETEKILQNAIANWQMMPPALLLHKQNTDAWSATQCLMHLNSYGNYYLPAIRRSIETAKNKNVVSSPTFTTSFIGNWFTNLMMPKGEEKTIRKMKAPKNHMPLTNANSDEVVALFIDQQETLLRLLEDAKTVNLQKAKTPISLSPFVKLPLGDTFRFLIAHNYRHTLQAEKAIAAAGKIKAVW